MASNVEEIVIRAKDEATEIIQGVTGTMGGLTDALKVVVETLGPVGIGLAGLTAGLAAATATGLGLADTVRSLDLLSARTGVGVEQLQVLRRQIVEFGGDAESMTQALNLLNRSIAQQDPLLAKLGITSKDTLTVFLQLGKAFESSSDTAKKTEIAYQLMGRGAARMVGILPQLAKGFDDSTAAMKDAGLILGGTLLEDARKLHEEAIDLNRAWDGLMTRIRITTVPTANAVVEALNDMWDALAGRKKSPEEEQRRHLEALQEELAKFQAMADRPQTFVQTEGPGGEAGAKAFVDAANARILAIQNEIAKVYALRTERALLRHEEMGPDLIAPIDVGKGDEAAKKRAEDLATYADALKGTGIDAAFALDKITAMNKEAARLDIIAKLFKGNILFGPEVNKDITDTAAHFKELVEVAGMTPDQANARIMLESAAALATKQKQLAEQGEKARDALILGPVPVESLKEYEKQFTELTHVLDLSPDEATAAIRLRQEREAQKRKRDLAEEFLPDTAKVAAAEWVKNLQDLTSGASIAKDALDAMGQALETGFSNALHLMASGMGNFGSVAKAVLSAIEDAVIELAARIAALFAAKAIASFIPGLGPILAMLSTAPAPGTTDQLIAQGQQLVDQQAALVDQLAALPTIALPDMTSLMQQLEGIHATVTLDAGGALDALAGIHPDVSVDATVAARALTRVHPTVVLDAAAAAQQIRGLRPAVMVDAQQRALAQQVVAMRPPTLTPPRTPSATLLALGEQLFAPLQQVIAQLAQPRDNASAAPAPAPMNIVVNGYDNYSIVQDLTSPAGKLRSAHSRVAFMGAY